MSEAEYRWPTRLALRGVDWLWPGHPRQWADVPRRLRPSLSWVLRLTTAAVLGFGLTALLTGVTNDLTGALTALLVVQVSAFSSLRMGIVRVGAVLVGVVVAVLLSNWFGLTWWSLGAAVAASLMLARLLRLGEQMLEAPISAMLILAVHGSDVAVNVRVLSTMIGAAVGMLFGLVLAPPVPQRQAASEVRRVADEIATTLRQSAETLRARPIVSDDVLSFQDSLRSVGRQVSTAADRVADVRDLRRLNVRAIGTPDAQPLLTEGLNTLERVLAATRALFTVLLREAPDVAPAEVADQSGADHLGAESRPAFAVVLDTMADCIVAYGVLVEDEVHHGPATNDALAQGLETLRETRAILTDLMLVDVFEEPSLWLLRGSVLSAVEQTLNELDVIERQQSRIDAGTPLNRPTQ